MIYKENIIPISQYHRTGEKRKETNYLVIHSTGNAKSTDENEASWLHNLDNKRYYGFHYAVDDDSCTLVIPLDEITWNAGNKDVNNTSLSIEICEEGDRIQSLKNAVELSAKLLIDWNLTMENVRKHQDITGKNCPRILLDKNYILVKDGIKYNWDWFYKELEKEFNRLNNKTEDWKLNIGKEALREGIITDVEWLNKLDENCQNWAVMAMCLNTLKKIRKENNNGIIN